MKTSHIPVTDIPLPMWLEDPRSVQEITYENFFTTSLEKMAGGQPLSQLVREDPRNLSYASVLNWIHKDEKRQKMYYEAQALGAEAVADELLYIADGTGDSLEDVQRSKLRVDTRKWLIEVWNRKRFGRDRDMTDGANTRVTIVIGDVMKEEKVIEGTVIDE